MVPGARRQPERIAGPLPRAAERAPRHRLERSEIHSALAAVWRQDLKPVPALATLHRHGRLARVDRAPRRPRPRPELERELPAVEQPVDRVEDEVTAPGEGAYRGAEPAAAELEVSGQSALGLGVGTV